MNIESLEAAKEICKRITEGTLLDPDTIDETPIQLRLSNEEQSQLPAGYLSLMRMIVERDAARSLEIKLAKMEVRALAACIDKLIDDLRQLQGY